MKMSQIQVATISEDYDRVHETIGCAISDFDPIPTMQSRRQQPWTITAQPRPGSDNNEIGARRPMPIDTTNWISTPRSIMNPVTSLQFLSGVRQLEIQQTVDLRTLMGDCSSGNHYKYRVKVPRAETLFLATELADPRIVGSSRGFTVHLQDASGQTAFSLKKGRTWGCIPGLLHKLSVDGDDEFIGSVEQDFTILSTKFTIYDGSRVPLCRIYYSSPFCSCTYKEARFQVSSLDGCRPLASITLHWDRPDTDYTLIISFPLDTDPKLKSLILGAAFLMESLYFERLNKSAAR